MREKFKRISEESCDYLLDGNGDVVAKFDLSVTTLSPKLAQGFLRALAALHGHTKITTQKGVLYSIKYFARYLESEKGLQKLPLPEDVLIKFNFWLSTTAVDRTTQRQIQNKVLAIFQWCHRNIKGIASVNTNFKTPRRIGLTGGPRVARNRFDEATIKRVLAACYREIEQIEARIAYGEKLQNSRDLATEDLQTANVLKELLVEGNGRIPLNKELKEHKRYKLIERVKNAGGLNKFRRLISLALDDILPFYIAVLVQSAGNAVSILKINVDCIRQHPLRDDLEFLDWDKGRARKEQRVDFSKEKKWSAPNIIRRLLPLNKNLRSIAYVGMKDKVFLAVGFQQNLATVPCNQTLHFALEDFLEKYKLPNFDFVDWRHTNAEEHHRVTGSLEAAQSRLNHGSLVTTSRYTNTLEFSDWEYQKIHRFQGSLITKATQNASNVDSGKKAGKTHREKNRTVFGFDCKDPFSGMDGVTPPGKRCLNFTRCADCKGAIVVLDDVHVLAKILSAKSALEDAETRSEIEGWTVRFRILYANTLATINHSILPSIPETVIEKARLLVNRYPILRLE